MSVTKEQNHNFSWISFYNSSVGKKIITGITGWGLTLFVLFHMLGNLVFLYDQDAYNQLAYNLNSLSLVLYGVESVLLVAAVFHAVVSISIRFRSRRSRPSSDSEFLVWHLSSFKFGTYYSTNVNGVAMRDLSRLVWEKFRNPIYAFGYSGAIVLFGIHLRHGIWSSGQSLGILEGNTTGRLNR